MTGYYKISAIGTDHLEKPNGVCQDYCDVLQMDNGYTIAVIADGLGSAKRSDIGAKAAVRAALVYISKNIHKDQSDDFYLQLLEKAYMYAYNSVLQCAADMQEAAYQFNTTLTAAVYDGKALFYGQCGDGGIIALTYQGDYVCVTRVKKGESFNETYPLLGGRDNWSFGKYDGEVCAFTMMTDGIYDIVCHPLLANEPQPINIPFIRRFMDRNILKANNSEDFRLLQAGVSRFVSQNGLPGVTDDKTIVGVINTDIMPQLKEDEYYKEPDWDMLGARMKKKLSEKNVQKQQASAHEPVYKAAEYDERHLEISRLKNKNSKIRNANSILRKIVIVQFCIIISLILCLCISLRHNGSNDKKERSKNASSVSAVSEGNDKEKITTASEDEISRSVKFFDKKHHQQ